MTPHEDVLRMDTRNINNSFNVIDHLESLVNYSPTNAVQKGK